MTVRGAVTAQLEAVVRLRVRGPAGDEVEVDAVVDTGDTGVLVLPTAVVAALNLARRSSSRAVLADGSVRRFDTYTARIEWGGGWRKVVASAVGNEALVGVGLLMRHGLRVDFVPGGLVEVVPLP